MEEPIFLTGFMGTGKSKIGFLLSRCLRRDFVDTDQLIPARFALKLNTRIGHYLSVFGLLAGGLAIVLWCPGGVLLAEVARASTC